jgi:hypothetical protein
MVGQTAASPPSLRIKLQRLNTRPRNLKNAESITNIYVSSAPPHAPPLLIFCRVIFVLSALVTKGDVPSPVYSLQTGCSLVAQIAVSIPRET